MYFEKFKSAVKDYFSFNTRERKGIIVLLLIIIVNLTVQFYLKYFTVAQEFYFEQLELESLVPDSVIENFTESHTGFEKDISGNQNLKNLKLFDPNTVDSLTLTEFGLDKKLIGTLINYRRKGGKFYKKEDLAKVYGISKSRYDELYPYIQIEDDFLIQGRPHVQL